MTGSEKLYTRMQQEIGSLAMSINEIVTKFKAMHHPLEESQERVPQATEQLDKISRETEAATHQMLDRVEGITQREEEVIAGLQAVREQVMSGSTEGTVALIDGLVTSATTTLNDAYLIMDALQFQDITAQQMNHAASLLEDIQTRLHAMIAVMQGQEPDEVEGQAEASKGPRRAFDPHADLSDKRTVQEDIDSLFAQKK